MRPRVLPACRTRLRSWAWLRSRLWWAWRRPRETRENLFQFLQRQGYHLCLLHPRQTHEFAKQRGLRAKTDRLDAGTIARVLLSGEARIGYVPDEQVSSYRELVRLHTEPE